MLWEKGEQLAEKAKGLMAGLKTRIAMSMAQKKSAREAEEGEESKKGWSSTKLSKWEQEEQELLAQIEYDRLNANEKMILASPRAKPAKGILG